MRVLLGLDAPTAGACLINGKRYADLRRPMHEVGALLDAGAVHGGRTALTHLRCLARANRIGRDRVMSVLDYVGLGSVARKRIGGFSLGMKQRLGIAAALLGDPQVLLFDEPVNGLDPDGVRWIRELMRSLAGSGRTVLVSSHLMSEMQLTADRLVIIGRGRLIAQTTVQELAHRFAKGVLVRSPRARELAGALESAGASVRPGSDDRLVVHRLDVCEIGNLAAARGIPVWEVTPRTASLEEAYLDLTAGAVDYPTGGPA
jgi:ABC-2 type transport system ATP-binding protein